ncbi:uncharacterized protein LOC119097583 isoform X2 [Pollicipes pollicipes]|uniref:uncharacterized protein LOC119097583 isoform X2 n=1 Tax=Pollicipes pollicipes TaxID=41117 RepID=UPI001884C0C0|nr:uncharacterized protein LOC119097583 isoform X2 [Pollicipes pollicipes]
MEQTDATADGPPPGETTPLIGSERKGRCEGCCCCQTVALALLTACVIIMVLAAVTVVSAFSLVGYPWHASCQADWTFGKPCPDVMSTIVDQMNAWAGPDGCVGGGEKCLYEVTSAAGNVVTGTHTTPVAKYVDELKLTFVNGTTGTCRMEGYSRSKTWYAYLDSSTNYCNMKNLIVGSGLDQGDPVFSESTSDSICTQYSSADCDKY